MGYKQFTPDILQAQDVNEYLMNQAVMVFDSAAARNLALTAPTEGMIVYLKDTNVLQIYDGSAWSGISTTGAVRADTSGVDGGIVMRGWSSYTGLATNGMTSSEYLMLSEGTNQFISAGVGGTVYMRAGNDDTSGQVAVSANRVNMTGIVSNATRPTYNGYHLGGGNYNPGGGPVIPATTVINNGSWFNTSTGRFTVPSPYSGYVLCSFNSLMNKTSGTSHSYVEFQVDGVQKSVRNHTSYNTGSIAYEPLSNTAIVYCSSGQYVTCNLFCIDGGNGYGGMYGPGLMFTFLG